MPSVEDRFAISELLNRMAYFYDENHLDDLAACFAPDALMSMQIGGGDMVGPFEGRDSIMELYRGAKPMCGVMTSLTLCLTLPETRLRSPHT